MPISKETKERIAQDAEDNRPANEGMLRRQGFVDGYIAGGEAEAERAQPVIEALEHLINDVRRKPNDTRYTTALNKATEALANYNSKPVK